MIEIMDTTLRDGEQTSGVSFAAHEKLSIAQVLLNDLGVNRVEIASARVSDGEFEAVKRSRLGRPFRKPRQIGGLGFRGWYGLSRLD